MACRPGGVTGMADAARRGTSGGSSEMLGGGILARVRSGSKRAHARAWRAARCSRDGGATSRASASADEGAGTDEARRGCTAPEPKHDALCNRPYITY